MIATFVNDESRVCGHLLTKQAVDAMSAFFPDSERVFGQGRLAEEGAGIQQANPSCGLSHDWTVPAPDFSLASYQITSASGRGTITAVPRAPIPK
jgi:hypothetical protein